MEKILKFLETVALIEKADDNELEEMLGEFQAVDFLIKRVNEYEKQLAKILKEQKKRFVDATEKFVAKDEITIAALLNYFMSDLFFTDSMGDEISEESMIFLSMTIPELVSEIMQLIDTDIELDHISKDAVDWMQSWSSDLGKMMKLSSHKEIEDILTTGISEGWGIEKMVVEMKDLPAFTRKRARTTAITEVLTAASVAQQEAYTQSPAVEGKTWLHSGGRKNKPRQNHVELNDTTIPVHDSFDVGGYSAKYPRDTTLPAKERVNCHCCLTPSVNEDIFGMTKQEKEAMRADIVASDEFEANLAKLREDNRKKYSV